MKFAYGMWMFLGGYYTRWLFCSFKAERTPTYLRVFLGRHYITWVTK